MVMGYGGTKRNNNYPKMNRIKSKLNQIRHQLIGKTTAYLQSKQKKKIENPYLNGIFAPVDEVWLKDLKVTGQIPKQLDGILLRIGPNPLDVVSPSQHHWFAGDGMLHGLRLKQGKAEWFKSRYIGTDRIQQSKGQPKKSGFRRGPGDVVNTNAFLYANKIWALIEAGTYPVCLDFELNTESHRLFNSQADLPFTAHPHQDLKTGHLHAICYDALNPKSIFYEVFDQSGDLIHYAPIAVEHGPMIHDCAVTDQDVLIFDLPVTFSRDAIFSGSNMPYLWNNKHQARIGILPHYGSAQDIHWIEIEPCFVFHTVNAYRETEHRIIVDVVVHAEMFKESTLGPFDAHQVQLERWIVDLNLNRVKRQILDNETQEFPRIDERYMGQPHRYIYSASYDSREMTKANALLCHDIEQELKIRFEYGDQWLTGEVIFIAEDDQEEQGKGYLLSYVHHVDGLASKVVILKANGTQLSIQAEIDLGVRVPIGFHTNWADLSPYA